MNSKCQNNTDRKNWEEPVSESFVNGEFAIDWEG
jgi:hypothetical protein